ncbi:hypothetical protein [Microbulbifer sp. ALW1]|uniref:hypothetical protein n=1 Tax=Microbulbifer sp. (strain ALW1) TaxID=1516059 RepID=UPI001359EE99|nr:hypothetical protein [Microbulbifer sp. ALW1]
MHVNAASLDATVTISPDDTTWIWSLESSHWSPGEYIGIHVEEGANVSAAVLNIFGFNFIDFREVDIEYSLAGIDSLSEFNNPMDLTWFASSVNSLTATLLSGMDYILGIHCVGDCFAKIKTKIEVSAVPLPAAFWLFGSALLGFVFLSNRKST